MCILQFLFTIQFLHTRQIFPFSLSSSRILNKCYSLNELRYTREIMGQKHRNAYYIVCIFLYIHFCFKPTIAFLKTFEGVQNFNRSEFYKGTSDTRRLT